MELSVFTEAPLSRKLVEEVGERIGALGCTVGVPDNHGGYQYGAWYMSGLEGFAQETIFAESSKLLSEKELVKRFNNAYGLNVKSVRLKANPVLDSANR